MRDVAGMLYIDINIFLLLYLINSKSFIIFMKNSNSLNKWNSASRVIKRDVSLIARLKSSTKFTQCVCT